MVYRICKSFEVESGHMLSKHPGLCRHPHGHSRRIDVVLASDTLDDNDMVCDFKAIKLALREQIQRLDHAMAINSSDPLLKNLAGSDQRLILFDNTDPTTEVLARHLFDFLTRELTASRTYRDDHGVEFRFPTGLRLERIRVTETSSSWAEYGTS